MTICWSKTNCQLKIPTKRIYASAKWDDMFAQINPQKVKYQHKERFHSIHKQYLENGYMTEKQANAIQYTYEDQQPKPRYGISARSFRGISRVVGEGVY